MSPHGVAIAAIALLLVLSAVMALSETAFVRANRIRLLTLAEEGDKRADRVLRLLEQPEQTLNGVLLVLLACQMVSATLLGTVLEPAFGAAGVAVGMVIEIVVVFTILASVVAHGLSAAPLTARYASWYRAHPEDGRPVMEAVPAPDQRWRRRSAGLS